jgi:hypothetical protein
MQANQPIPRCRLARLFLTLTIPDRAWSSTRPGLNRPRTSALIGVSLLRTASSNCSPELDINTRTAQELGQLFYPVHRLNDPIPSGTRALFVFAYKLKCLSVVHPTTTKETATELDKSLISGETCLYAVRLRTSNRPKNPFSSSNIRKCGQELH